MQDIQDAIEAATKGRHVTEVFEGERRFGLVVKLAHDGDARAALGSLTVSAPSGERIPVTQVAEIIKTEGFGQILREGNVRRAGIKWGVRGRDMGGLVAEAMRKVEAAVRLPEGYSMVWSGRFEDQQRALARLSIIVPLVIFFAVFGVSVLNGVVLVSSIREAFAEGRSFGEAIVVGCELRFRPIVVSAIVAIIGFLPAALSHGIGSETQRPLAGWSSADSPRRRC